MERKINEVFEDNGVKLKCVLTDWDECEKCHFADVDCFSQSFKRNARIGNCEGDCRKDGNGVVFKKVGLIMSLSKTIRTLRNYNKWRRGAEIPMPEPKEIGKAIEVAIHLMSELNKSNNKIKTVKK